MSYPARAPARSLRNHRWLRPAAVAFLVLSVLAAFAPTASAERLSPGAGNTLASDAPDYVIDSDILEDGRVVTVGARQFDSFSPIEPVVALWSAEGSLLDALVMDVLPFDPPAFFMLQESMFVDSREVSGTSGVYQAVVQLPSAAVAVFTVTSAGLELDPGFNNAQPATMPMPSGAGFPSARGVSFDPSGSVVLLGDDGDMVWVARLISNGTPDGSFGRSGTGIAVLSPAVGGSAQPHFVHGAGLAVQPDGRVLYSTAALPATGDGHIRSIVGRLTSGGAPDASFDRDGQRLLPNIAAGDVRVEDLALDESSGKTVLAASVDSADAPCVVMRLTSSGTLDRAFSNDGIAEVQAPLNQHQDPYPCTVQSVSSYNANIRLAASSGSDFDVPFVVAMVSSAALDTSFGTGGYATFPSIYSLDGFAFFDVEIGPSLDTLVAGMQGSYSVDDNSSAYDSSLGRLLPSGSPDTSFSEDGFATADLGGWSS